MTTPKGPCHVDNLNSISKLSQSGFQGVDCSLDTSLFEYSLVWKVLETETIFVYKLNGDNFDRCSISNDVDASKEWDWASFLDVARFCGTSVEELLEQPLPAIVSDLVNYYGYEEIFGTSYWEGFKISED
jgi:hypothetical protein